MAIIRAYQSLRSSVNIFFLHGRYVSLSGAQIHTGPRRYIKAVVSHYKHTAGAHQKRWRLPEGHLWRHACDRLGVSVEVSQAHWPQHSSGRWSFPSAGRWDWYAGASAGHTWGASFRPRLVRYPYTLGAEGQFPGPTAHIKVRRIVQGGCWTTHGLVLRGCWHRILATGVPDE